MGTFEWIAVLGAAAWIPQVVSWVARAVVKPRIRVIPSRAPEVGYTSLGPIFNLTCAISTDRKDAVIERVSAAVTHERGQSTEFVWSTLNETFSQVRSPEGIAEVSKNQPAVALKVSTLVLSEKQIGMQDAEFEEASRQLINDLYRAHDHLKRTDPDHYQARTIASPEFTELIGFARRRFTWQAGTYTVNLALRLAGVREPTTQEFQFTLTNNDIDRMRENLQTIEQYVRDLIQPPDEPRTHRWNWSYPPFSDNQLPVASESRGG